MKDEEKVVNEYYRKNVVTVLNSYSTKTSKLFYSIVYKKIIDRYGEEFEDKGLIDELGKAGKIYTASMAASNGMFDENTGNILIKHYLDKLTTFVFHEIVHKIGWIKNGKKKSKLNNVSKEGGTNIVTNESLKLYDGKMLYFGKYLARHPNIINGSYLSYELFMAQLNQVIGNEALPKSILNGDNSFDNKCKRFFGEEQYSQLVSTIRNIDVGIETYWLEYGLNSSKAKKTEEEIGSLVEKTQDEILTYSFDELIKSIKTKKDAEKYLNKLLLFSNYRIRKYSKKKTTDKFFVEYFNRKKKELEERTGQPLEITYDDTEWDKKYDFIKLGVVEVPNSEQKEIMKKGRIEQKKIKFRRIKDLFGIGNISVTTIDKPLYKGRNEFERVQIDLVKQLQDKFKKDIETSKKEKEDR